MGHRFRVAICLACTSLFLASCGTVNPHYDPAKSHHSPEGFRNPDGAHNRGFARFLYWQWHRLWDEETPQHPERVGRVAVDPRRWAQPEPGWRVAWIGHATMLVQVHGVNILTDPIFSERVSPLSWYGPKRVAPPALPIADLPPIDAVVISHNHYDHLDEATVRTLAGQAGGPPVFVVPLGLERWFAALGIDSVRPLDWWQGTDIVRGDVRVRIDLVPARHWSRRTPWDTNAVLWGGYAIAGAGAQAYFAGDTGYGDGTLFREIGRRYGGFDLAMIPVGCYEPRWFMAYQHVDPGEAVRIHADVGARYSMGMHWGAFRMCDEPVDAPLDDLPAARDKAGLPRDDFELWAVGERRRLVPGKGFVRERD